MTAYSAIVLNEETYAPSGVAGNIHNWRYITPGVPGTGAHVLSLDIRPGQGNAQGTTKVQWKLKLPTVASEASACNCPGEILNNTFVDVIFTLPDAGDPLVRQNLLAQLQDLVSDQAFVASVESFEGVW